MTRPSGSPIGRIWGEFCYVPANAIESKPDECIVRFRRDATGEIAGFTEVWPVKRALANLGCLAAHHHKAIEPTRESATMAEIRSWVALTRSLASRFPYGGPVADKMIAVAAAVERLHETPARCSAQAPQGRVKERNFQYNACLWAMDTLRKTARLPLKEFWPAYLGKFFDWLPDEQLPDFHDASITKRIRRFTRNLKPTAASAVMRGCLFDALTYGPMMPDGSARPGLELAEWKPPAQLPK